MPRYLVLLLTIGLTVYCVIDVVRSDERARRGLPRVLWLLVVLVPVVGAVLWLVLSRTGGSAAGPRRRPARPVAPDDDPDFLRRLDQERRRREREARGGDADADGASPDGAGDGAPDGDPSTT